MPKFQPICRVDGSDYAVPNFEADPSRKLAVGGRIDPVEPKVVINDRKRHLQGFEPGPGKSVGVKMEIGTHVAGWLIADGVHTEVQWLDPTMPDIPILKIQRPNKLPSLKLALYTPAPEHF